MACSVEYKGKTYTREAFIEFYKSNRDRLEEERFPFQLEGSPATEASLPTLAKVKEWLKRIGVDVNLVSSISVDGKVVGANGVARVANNLIEVVNGKEGVALTEEASHFAVALLEKYNPSLYKVLFNKIGQYGIMTDVMDRYKDIYTKEGKPDIVRIKQEAIAQLVSEMVIKQSDGFNEKPELLQVSKTWWEKVIDWIKALFNKSDYNPFEQVASEILSGKLSPERQSLVTEALTLREEITPSYLRSSFDTNPLGFLREMSQQLHSSESEATSARQILGNRLTEITLELFPKKGEEFLQINKGAEDFRKKLQEKIQQYGVEKVIDEKAKDEDDRNHYEALIGGKKVKTDRTTEYAKRENLKKFGGKNFLAGATKKQKEFWEEAAMNGTNGHKDLENMINDSLNPDETLKDLKSVRLTQAPLSNPGIYSILKDYLFGNPLQGMDGFLKQFPEGSVFITEQIVYNEKAGPTGRAGTMDLIVVYPDGKKKVYDWKFMGFNANKTDQAPQKRSQHALQLGDYKRTLREAYGEKNVELQTVPIGAIYKKNTLTQAPYLDSLIIGKLDVKDENNTFLLPVVPTDQSTGNPKIDELVKSLLALYQRLYRKGVSPEEKFMKNEQLNQLSLAIRNLQVALNFEPLAISAKNFETNIYKTLSKYEIVDFTKLSTEEIGKLLDELLHLDKAAITYSNLDKVYIEKYGKDNLGEKEKKVLDSLRASSNAIAETRPAIQDVIDNYVLHIAQENKLSNILSPEKQVKGIVNDFTESAFLPLKTANLLTKLVVEARSADTQSIEKQLADFGKIYADLVKEANGKNLLSTIGDAKTLELIRDIKKEFWDSLSNAKELEDKKFLLDNVNIGEYNELAEKRIAEREENIKATIFTTIDEEENQKIRDRKIQELHNELRLESDKFSGWKSPEFARLYNRAMKGDLHYSDEYKDLLNRPAALAMWNFITSLNRRAKNLGYLNQYQSMRFLPLVIGTIVERLSQAQNILSEGRAIMKDSFIVQLDEEQEFGKTDPETNKPIKSIPKLFTRTDKSPEQLSHDLLKIIPLYVRALQQYETSKELEMTALAIHKSEQNKGHLEINAAKNVIFENGVPKIYVGNENNAQIIETIVDDAIYGIKQDANTLADVAVDKIVKGDEATKEKAKLATKKTLQEANKYTQELAVGLKVLVALPNYVGAHIQSIVNAATFYKPLEYEKNHARVVGSVFTGKEGNIMKGLIDLVVPLNEDVAKLAQRKIARKQSPLKYLSTWSFHDVLMSSNQLPDMSHQLTNAYSWIDNTIVRDGKLVNIRQYLREQDRESKYKEGTSYENRRAIEKSFESRVDELKKESLVNIAKFNEEGVLGISGVDAKEIAAYRSRVVEYSRYITGQMDYNNKAQYRRNILVNSFMMFKNWIPKQVALRTLDIHKNIFFNEWEYGRTRLFLKTLTHLGLKNIGKIYDIVKATPEGLKIMREILEQKKEDYYKKTGQILNITPEEFFDTMRKELKNQFKELTILMGLVGLVIGAKLAAPDDDEDILTRNRYKFWAKATNKISDELWFYYSPTSAESITRGSVFPSLGILTKATKFFTSFEEEMRGHVVGDQEVVDKNHPLKYFLNLVPVASQFQNELLPVIDPEAAKNMGIHTTAVARALGQ